MRQLLLAIACVLAVVMTLAGCGCDSTSAPDMPLVDPFDMHSVPMCPSGVDAIGNQRIACTSHDTICNFAESPQVNITCHCECGKVWECDQVLAICDGGA
jgi:hypothetical protein